MVSTTVPLRSSDLPATMILVSPEKWIRHFLQQRTPDRQLVRCQLVDIYIRYADVSNVRSHVILRALYVLPISRNTRLKSHRNIMSTRLKSYC